jgi:NAD(P)-dependent dehydrogenase (short-subunit alcohol dehydrogenase family)
MHAWPFPQTKELELMNYHLRSGLGALIAEKFAAEGANVAVNYVSNAERAEETVSKIKSQYEVKTTTIQGVCFALYLVQKSRQLMYCMSRTWECKTIASGLSRRLSTTWVVLIL